MPATTPTMSPEANPFLKRFASSNRTTRDEALASLQSYLQRRATFSDLEFLKLWKGLFFCMWMSDKPLTQQRLARDLAGLVHILRGKDNFLGFVRAFWTTIAREWGGIDVLRMDKFMYLVRCYVREGFAVVGARQWRDETLLEEYLAVLSAVPLEPRDLKIPNGLRHHVVDVYVDELDHVDTTRTAPVEKILAPLRRLEKESLTKSVRERVRDALADTRLEDWQNAGDVGEEMDEAENDSEEPGLSESASQKKDLDDGEDDDEFSGFGD